jgi:hypothetical protein
VENKILLPRLGLLDIRVPNENQGRQWKLSQNKNGFFGKFLFLLRLEHHLKNSRLHERGMIFTSLPPEGFDFSTFFSLPPADHDHSCGAGMTVGCLKLR